MKTCRIALVSFLIVCSYEQAYGQVDHATASAGVNFINGSTSVGAVNERDSGETEASAMGVGSFGTARGTFQSFAAANARNLVGAGASITKDATDAIWANAGASATFSDEVLFPYVEGRVYPLRLLMHYSIRGHHLRAPGAAASFSLEFFGIGDIDLIWTDLGQEFVNHSKLVLSSSITSTDFQIDVLVPTLPVYGNGGFARYPFELTMNASVNGLTIGTTAIDSLHTLSLTAVTMPDGSPLESHGLSFSFSSGMAIPNVPEPRSSMLVVMALAIMVRGAGCRRGRPAIGSMQR